MAIDTKSIRTKLLGLLAFIALVVGGVSVALRPRRRRGRSSATRS